MPTSIRPFQNAYAKSSKSKDSFKQRKVMTSEKELSEEKKERLKGWITLYRLNIDIFCTHYLGLQLFPYQKLWIYLMNLSDVFVAIASRASAKSWLVAVFSIAKAILWPGSEIVIVSSTQKQASIIIGEKIGRLIREYPMIQREISDYSDSPNKWEVLFHNTSKIRVVAAGETGRGARSTLTIYEEFRLLDKEIVDSVVKPFAYSRQSPFLRNEEYEKYVEEPKEIYISSSYYKQHWWFNMTGQVMKMMLAGKSAGVIFLDYLITIKHKLKTPKQIDKEKVTMSSETFDMEYCNLVLGAGEKSYFNINMFIKSRTLKNAVYPQRSDTFNPRKNIYDNLTRVEGEIRLLSVDCAMRTGARNDNTIIIFIRLLPLIGKGYHREVLYCESHNGMNSVSQTLRIKQLIEDFQIDAGILDIQTSGITLLDMLGVLTKDSERGREYEPLTIINHPSIDPKVYEELSHRCLSRGAKEMIYPISGTAKLNSDIAVMLKDRLKKKMFSFLVNDGEAEDILMKNKIFRDETKDDSIIKSWYLQPFVQQNLMIQEILGLDAVLSSGNIRLQEKPGQRKDRYSALAYGSWFASYLDAELMKEVDNADDWSILSGLTVVY